MFCVKEKSFVHCSYIYTVYLARLDLQVYSLKVDELSIFIPLPFNEEPFVFLLISHE